MKDKGLMLIKLLVFILSIFLVFYGQKTVGREYLMMQFAGIIGLIFLLWNYNRKFV